MSALAVKAVPRIRWELIERIKTPYERTAAGLVAFLLAANAFRAWTQSITIDEAFNYNDFVVGGVSHIFSRYDAANHVLHTILCKISVSLFGRSEFTLRIPSLLGGAFYLVTAYRLCRYLLGAGAFFLLSFAALSLNPFVLDYLSVARGYGLATGFCLWMLLHLALYGSEHDPDLGLKHLRKAGLGAGLAVASNLTLLFPCAAVATLLFAHAVIEGLLARSRAAFARRLAQAADHFAVPALVTAFLIMVLTFSKASKDNFYYGVRTLGASLESIVYSSFFHHSNPFFRFLRWPAAYDVARVVVPVVLAATVAAFAMIFVRWIRSGSFRKLDRTGQVLFWCGGALILMCVELVSANKLLGVLYPLNRTGLYLVPFFCLTFFALLARMRVRAAAAVGVAAAGVCLIQFTAQFSVGPYAEWRQDSGLRATVEALRSWQATHPREKVRVGAWWEFEPGLNFYRRVYGLKWMEPVERSEPGGDFDCYVLRSSDRGLIEKRQFVKLYENPSGVLLAVPKRAGK